MIEMLKTRKEALQARGVKGFTLMEMLIVIAIIAVLVAIAIPVLGAQLDKARATTDEANIRDGYASAQVTILQSNATPASGTYYGLNSDGTVTAGAEGTYICQGKASSLGSVNVGGLSATWNNGDHIYYIVGTNGAVSTIATSVS